MTVSDFDDKLNAILGNPDSMAQIMQLAQSLSGGNGTSSPNATAAPPPPPPPEPPKSAPGFDGFDGAMLQRFLPLMREMQSPQQSNASQLLLALRPYLKEEKQEKVGRAIQIAKLIRMGKYFFSGAED